MQKNGNWIPLLHVDGVSGFEDCQLPYFSHLMQRADLLEQTLMLGGLKAGGEGNNRG